MLSEVSCYIMVTLYHKDVHKDIMTYKISVNGLFLNNLVNVISCNTGDFIPAEQIQKLQKCIRYPMNHWRNRRRAERTTHPASLTSYRCPVPDHKALAFHLMLNRHTSIIIDISKSKASLNKSLVTVICALFSF